MGDRQDGTEPMTAEVAVMVLGSPNASERMVAEAVATLAALVDQKIGGQWRDVTGPDGKPQVWHFIGYRPDAAQLGKHSPSTLNAPDVPQYQGVIFADGTVAMRWMTAKRSTSVWDTFADMFEVHGHPEYGTQLYWPNGAPTEAVEAIEAAMQAHRDREADRASELEREAQLAAEGGDAITEANNRGEFLLPEATITYDQLAAAAESQRETWRAARAQLAQALGLDPHMTWPELIADVRRVPPFTTTKEQR